MQNIGNYIDFVIYRPTSARYNQNLFFFCFFFFCFVFSSVISSNNSERVVLAKYDVCQGLAVLSHLPILYISFSEHLDQRQQ